MEGAVAVAPLQGKGGRSISTNATAASVAVLHRLGPALCVTRVSTLRLLPRPVAGHLLNASQRAQRQASSARHTLAKLIRNVLSDVILVLHGSPNADRLARHARLAAGHLIE